MIRFVVELVFVLVVGGGVLWAHQKRSPQAPSNKPQPPRIIPETGGENEPMIDLTPQVEYAPKRSDVFRQPTIDGAKHVFLRDSNYVSWIAEAGPNQPRNPTLATAKTFHDAFAQEFISHEGIGRSRIPRMAFDMMPRQWIELTLESEGSRLRAFGPKKHEPRYDEGTQQLHYSDGQSTRVREQVWVLQKFELMKTGAEPRAYVSDIWSMDHGSMKRNFESMKTRVVNEFEKTAIEQLKKN
ncbi:MAG: hypothetical protein ACRCZF_13450, partial [Gemmataceae bacterium]